MATDRLSVAIVGGGMCGVCCAVALSRAGIEVHLFESGSKFGEVGAGVGIGPNAVDALEGLGVLDAVLTRIDPPQPKPRPFLFVTATDPIETIYDYPVRPDDRSLGIYRPVFLEALGPSLNPSIVHFNKRCVGYENLTRNDGSKGIRILFSDSTVHEADLCIGADGVRSAVREQILKDLVTNDSSHLAFSGFMAYRGLVPFETLKADGIKADVSKRPHCFMGDGKHIVVFPIQAGRIINIVAFVSDEKGKRSLPLPLPWVESVPQQKLLDDYRECGRDVQILLNHLENLSRWSIHEINPPLKTFKHERCVLIGDAAHAMQPHLGAGVGQGFEDAFVLCSLLTSPIRMKLEEILERYDEARVPRANFVSQASSDTGQIFEDFRNLADIDSLRERLSQIWEPVWRYDIKAQVEEIMTKLKKS